MSKPSESKKARSTAWRRRETRRSLRFVATLYESTRHGRMHYDEGTQPQSILNPCAGLLVPISISSSPAPDITAVCSPSRISRLTHACSANTTVAAVPAAITSQTKKDEGSEPE